MSGKKRKIFTPVYDLSSLNLLERIEDLESRIEKLEEIVIDADTLDKEKK